MRRRRGPRDVPRGRYTKDTQKTKTANPPIRRVKIISSDKKLSTCDKWSGSRSSFRETAWHSRELGTTVKGTAGAYLVRKQRRHFLRSSLRISRKLLYAQRRMVGRLDERKQ
jgi:hypothetical protein